nr:glycosyltransferase family 2 protein [Acetobacter estunensis]
MESYRFQPLAVAKNNGIWPKPKYRKSLVACARWESQYIIEWILYHQSIGFDHIYLYCNDDDPSDLYENILPFVIGENPFVTFHHYNFLGLQLQMYFHFMRNYMHETEWMMFLDIDEFVCIRGLNDINLFISSFPEDMDAMYFNWCSFGNNGHKTRPNGSVLLNYIRREDGVTPFTKVLIKSIVVPYAGIFDNPLAPIVHDYTGTKKGLNVRNVLGDNISDYYSNFPHSAGEYLGKEDRRQRIIQKSFVAHYNIKSDEDFDIRVRRSLVGTYAGEKMWGEKTKEEREVHHQETNAVVDTYLHDYWKTVMCGGWRKAIFPVSNWPIISRNKDSRQSSTAHARSVFEDAKSLVSGEIFGKPQSQTNIEDNPWWEIDLGDIFFVHEMRLFNSLEGDFGDVAWFELSSSTDGICWINRFNKTDGKIYGGADGYPFIWQDAQGIEARYLRITIPGKARRLQFDQIEFYGKTLGGC